MKFIKKFCIFILFILALTSLQVFIVSLAIVPTLTSRDTVRDLVSGKATYDALVVTVKSANISDFLQPDSEVSTEDERQFNADQKELFGIIDEVITYEKYSELSTEASDDVYDWLEGETVLPEVEIVLAKNSKETVNLLKPAFVSKYQSLDECPSNFVEPTDYSPLSAECKLPGTDGTVVEKYLQESAEDPDFDELFSEISFSAKDTPITKEQSAFVQDNYARIKLLPTVSAVTTVVAILLISALIRTKRGISKTIGIISLLAGMPILISALFIKYLPISTIQSFVSRGREVFSTSSLAEILLSPITSKLIVYSSVSVIVGAVLLIAGRYFRRKEDSFLTEQPVVNLSNITPQVSQTNQPGNNSFEENNSQKIK